MFPHNFFYTSILLPYHILAHSILYWSKPNTIALWYSSSAQFFHGVQKIMSLWEVFKRLWNPLLLRHLLIKFGHIFFTLPPHCDSYFMQNKSSSSRIGLQYFILVAGQITTDFQHIYHTSSILPHLDHADHLKLTQCSCSWLVGSHYVALRSVSVWPFLLILIQNYHHTNNF